MRATGSHVLWDYGGDGWSILPDTSVHAGELLHHIVGVAVIVFDDDAAEL